MRRVITYARIIASIGALIALIIAGGKLADHNYNIIVECWVMGACLVTLFSILSVFFRQYVCRTSCRK